MVEALRNPRTHLRRRIDAVLGGFLRTQAALLDDAARPLLHELERVIGSGGKRLRPTFCYWGHLASSGTDDDRIVTAAGALELVHTFAIVHDDIMDLSPLRRGAASTWKAFAMEAETTGGSDPARAGTAAAILTGDLALVLADCLLGDCGFEPPVLDRARARFDAMRTRAIAGQLLDLRAAQAGSVTEPEARRIGALKSGGYTVADPLAIGAALGSDDAGVQEVLAAYGRPLGEAFQLRDDVLGVFGDPDRTGKDRDGDLREGKQTVLVAKARAAADPSQRRVLDHCLGRPDLSPDDAERVRDVIRDTGALSRTQSLIGELGDAARGALDPDVIPVPARTALVELAAEVAERDA